MEKLFNNSEEAMKFIVNLNKCFFLDRKEHIKKYYKVRKIHSSILDSMIGYIDNGKLPVEEYFNRIADDIRRETNNMEFTLDNREYNDGNVFNELFIYKNHSKIPSLTEIYIKNKKFKNTEKIKMLYAMRDSVVGLFKIIKYDNIEGYVTYQDIFTNKRYKVIDVAMSCTGQIHKENDIYIYNRIIKYDGILFGTGIPCILTRKNKRLMQFIKKHKYKNCSDFSRCVMLYDISKDSDNGINKINYHNY